MSNFHALWCDHRESGETHDDTSPYCLCIVHSVKLIATEGEELPAVWVYATAPAHAEALAAGERVPDEHLYDGIEMVTEHRVNGEWVERKLRLTSDAARSLAATLVRAADIQQGLTR